MMMNSDIHNVSPKPDHLKQQAEEPAVESEIGVADDSRLGPTSEHHEDEIEQLAETPNITTGPFKVSTKAGLGKKSQKSKSSSDSASDFAKDNKTRRQVRGGSSDACKTTESGTQENGLVKWLRSHTPKEQALTSQEEAKADVVKSDRKPTRNKQVKKQDQGSVKDDALRIKQRVKYLLNKMNREKSLIDAYSTDGWKGQSLEKLRPEQELKKAEMQILQCKLGIREALQQLHILSLEGSIEDSAFDGEGQIYHDDIFCAKCKSKEYFPDNDIILCDGACNRAFHQFCLEPPLKTEDIPPGDEGWLCPACDSKLECLDAINDHLEMDFKLEDSWEKIFSEAVLDASGESNLLGAMEDLPSEDSSDDDYNPEGENRGTEEKLSQDGVNADSSESDSDSDSDSSDDSSGVIFFDEFAGTSKAVNFDEYTDTEEIEPELDGDEVLVTGKRQRKDVDYKQLYDEVYGANASDYDSSEDEDYGKSKRPKKMKDSKSPTEGPCEKEENRENEKVQQETSDASQGRKSSAHLPAESVVKLQEMFEECQLPSKSRKEELSKQLSLTYAEVNSWFRNARRKATKKKHINGLGKENTDNLGEEIASAIEVAVGTLDSSALCAEDTTKQSAFGDVP